MHSRVYTVTHWVADDTEESILGADWHQQAIGNLHNGLEQVARAAALPWHVGNQLTLVAWHPNGTPWRPVPDIMLHPFAGPQGRTEMDAQSDGVPALIVEVASPSTWRKDVEMDPAVGDRTGDGAKAYEYLALGVTEYLVFDPEGHYLPGQVRAWRQREGRQQTWTPDRQGRYRSTELGIAFVPEGLFLRIIDQEGRPVPFIHEQGETIVTLDRRARALAIGRRMIHVRARRQSARAEQEAARAEQEAARAEQEMRRRQQAEADVASLRAELDRLRSAGHEEGSL